MAWYILCHWSKLKRLECYQNHKWIDRSTGIHVYYHAISNETQFLILKCVNIVLSQLHGIPCNSPKGPWTCRSQWIFHGIPWNSATIFNFPDPFDDIPQGYTNSELQVNITRNFRLCSGHKMSLSNSSYTSFQSVFLNIVVFCCGADNRLSMGCGKTVYWIDTE